MRGLLSMIGMQTELEYQVDDFTFGFTKPLSAILKGNFPSG